ncbi:MAG: glycosyltransferase [Propionibacterium sp.]|nr:glycosyltransferase [Propionibacterium sp.]
MMRRAERRSGRAEDRADLDPLRAMVAEVDVDTAKMRIVSGEHSDPRALVLVRRGRRVVDLVEVVGAHDLPGRILGSTRVPTAERAWAPGGGRCLSASIVICTVGTNPLLPDAVRSALAQEAGRIEVVVVDNAPGTGGTRRLLRGVEDPRLRIVEEPAAGLSRARNCGVAHSHGEVVAFTDDDAVTDPAWLIELLDVFAADLSGEVGGVTGITLPAQLRHRSQRFFESRGGFPKSLEPTVWALGPLSARVSAFGAPGAGGPLHPLTTARIGAGVSMAFRREVLRTVGPFDPALGAGTRTLGGEDMDMFARVLRSGWAIVQTPDSVVFHTHRPTVTGLRRQVHGNGTGSAALVTKSLIEDPRRLIPVLVRLPEVRRRLARGSERMAGRDADVPSSLGHTEITGLLRGPGLYLRSRLDVAVGGGYR